MQATIKRTKQIGTIKSTTTDTFDNTKNMYELVDVQGDTIWYNGSYRHHTENSIIINK